MTGLLFLVPHTSIVPFAVRSIITTGFFATVTVTSVSAASFSFADLPPAAGVTFSLHETRS